MNLKKIFKKKESEKILTLSEEIDELEKDIERTKNMLSGIGWFVLTCLFSALCSILIKQAMQTHTAFQVIVIQCFGGSLLFLPFIIKTKGEIIKTKSIKLYLIRGVYNVIVSVLWFYSLKYAPLPEAISLKFAMPIFITLLAIFSLKEKPKFTTIISLIAGFIGILIIVNPKFDEFKLIYLLILVSSFVSALYHITVKKLTRTDSSNTITFYSFFIVGMMSLPFVFFSYQPFIVKDLLIFIPLILCTFGYFKFMAIAYSKTDISVLQPFDFMRLVFVSIISYFIFDTKTNPWTVVGSIIILSSTTFLAIGKKYEHKLTKSKKMIKKLMEAKSNFFANINHELRTPLNAILGFSKIIKANKESEKATSETYQFTKQIESAGEHLLGMVNNILDATKLEKNKMVLAEDKYDLVNEIIYPCIKMLEVKSKEKNIDLVFSNKEKLNYLVFVDKIKIKQVLINLLSNAIKFTHKKGTIKINVEKDKDDIAISIKDNGIGIAKKDIPLILQEYMQTIEGIKREQGTGLGLPISKKITELHSGKFSINSTLGRGTTITITIPKQRIKKAIKEKIEQNKNNETVVKKIKYDFPKKKIIIVDDNFANNLVLEKIIKSKKITENIISIGDAKKILSTVKKERPNLLILDQNLNSHITGSKISNTLKNNKKFKKMPIIMLTADTFKEDVNKIMKESQAEACLEKPIDFEKLDKTIRKLIK